MVRTPMRVAVTGTVGQIGYALLFRIVVDGMLDEDQPVILQLLEIPDEKVRKALRDAMMEIEDCAPPLLAGMEAYSDPMTTLKDIDVVLLVGARPRGLGMEHANLLSTSAQIFTAQGKALNAIASRNAKVLAVGNPTNTNTYTTMKSVPDPSRENFTATLHLDHSHALSRITTKTSKPMPSIEELFVRGNHSPAMYADYRCATIDGKGVKDMTNDPVWNNDASLPTVGKHSAVVIEAHDLSSAVSAANVAIDYMHDWVLGSNGEIVAMGIPSNGEYDTPKDVMFGFPVTTENDKHKIIEGLEIDEYSQGKVKTILDELEVEHAGIRHLL